MDLTASDQSRKPSKSRFFDASKWIDGLNIKRAMRNLLTAMLFLVDNKTLSTPEYPVTIDDIVAKSGYSRSQTFEILNDLERAGIVERIRHRRQLPSGEWINDPTTYRFIVDDAEREYVASVKAVEPPRQRHPKKEREPRQKANSSERAEPKEAPESSPPALPPIPVPERVKVNVAPAYVAEMSLPPQEPGNDPEVTDFGNDIVAHAEEALAEVAHLAKPQTIKAAKVGLYAWRYSLAVRALDVRDQFSIDESELIESVYEWARKSVAKNKSSQPSRLAGILGTFIDGKGNGITRLRRNLVAT